MRRFLSLLPVGLWLAASGCGAQESSTQLRFAFITNNASDFWTIARRGCEQADQELEKVEVEFKIPADGTAAEQKRIIDDLLVRGVHGIAISPVDPANQIGFLNQVAEQTTVITHDSDAPGSRRVCYVGTDNIAAGRQAGGLIRQALPQGGQIMVFVGMLDAQNARERFQGIKEELEGSGIEILDVRTDDTDRVRAKSNVLDTLVKHPDIDALVGLWSYNGPAILNAVRDAGKVGQVKIICFDEEDETLAGIRDGSIDSTVVQQPYEFGYQAVQILSRLAAGDRSLIPESGQIFVPTLIVNQQNVEEFTRKINQLRGRS